MLEQKKGYTLKKESFSNLFVGKDRNINSFLLGLLSEGIGQMGAKDFH